MFFEYLILSVMKNLPFWIRKLCFYAKKLGYTMYNLHKSKRNCAKYTCNLSTYANVNFTIKFISNILFIYYYY